ncbi:nitroreductase [bacterium]|nr:nitroreductase [bacterium]
MKEISIQELIKQRSSIRGYKASPVPVEKQEAIRQFIEHMDTAPLGNEVRIKWVSGQTENSSSLRRLGTYGMIRNPMGYIVGAVSNTADGVVDFGYQLELLVLELTRLELGSCWLGGSFTRSGFAKIINIQNNEIVPAVISVGIPLDKRTWLDNLTRRSAGSDRRKLWKELFFKGDFKVPFTEQDADDYTAPLEMLRLAPSASNRQPWRVIVNDGQFHFFVERLPSYHRTLNTLKLADLQRLDVGIGMSHFELTAREIGLSGHWIHSEPGIALPDSMTEYVATWQQG